MKKISGKTLSIAGILLIGLALLSGYFMDALNSELLLYLALLGWVSGIPILIVGLFVFAGEKLHKFKEIENRPTDTAVFKNKNLFAKLGIYSLVLSLAPSIITWLIFSLIGTSKGEGVFPLIMFFNVLSVSCWLMGIFFGIASIRSKSKFGKFLGILGIIISCYFLFNFLSIFQFLFWMNGGYQSPGI